MPRYEIVDPVIRELDSETAEDAAAIFHRQLLAEARRGDSLVHLAMWRDEAEPAAAARLPTPRQSLGAFFAAVERCAGGPRQPFAIGWRRSSERAKADAAGGTSPGSSTLKRRG